MRALHSSSQQVYGAMKAEDHSRQLFSATLGELSDITLDSPPNAHHAQLGDALLGYSALETQLANGSKLLGSLTSQFGGSAGQYCNVYLPQIHKLYKRYFKTARLYNQISTSPGTSIEKIESMRATLGKVEAELYDALSENSKAHVESMLEHVEKIVAGYQDHFSRCVNMSQSLLNDLREKRASLGEWDQEKFKPPVLSTQPKKKIEKGTPDANLRIQSQRKKILLGILLSEEEKYLLTVGALKENFYDVFHKDEKLMSKLSPQDAEAMFGNISLVQERTRELYRDLSVALQHWPARSVGQIFDEFSLPAVYKPYLGNLARSLRIVARARSQSKFISTWIKKQEEVTRTANPTLNVTSLDELLRAPLNRIRAYQQFLEKYNNQTSLIDPEHQSVVQSYCKIAEMENYILTCNDREQDYQVVQHMLKKLTGIDPTDFSEETQKFYFEGNLMTEDGENRRGFLFSDRLVVAEPKRSKFKTLLQVSLLSQCRFQEISESSFKLICGSPEKATTYLFSTSTPSEAADWSRAMKRVLTVVNRDRVFGVPLQELLENQKATHPDIDVPAVVHLAVEHLLSNDGEDLKTTGIFRVSGAKWEVDNYARRFDAGEHIDFHGTDPHCVAGVLKEWFLLLPSPIIPVEHYSVFLNAYAQHKGDMELAKTLVTLINALPDSSKNVLQYTMQLLAKTASFSEQNKMTPSNLAIVFGPGLLRPAEDTAFNPREQSLVFGVLEALIESYGDVFGEIERTRTQRAETLRREREDHQSKLQQASEEAREMKAAEFARALERTESKDGVDKTVRSHTVAATPPPVPTSEKPPLPTGKKPRIRRNTLQTRRAAEH